MLISCIDLSHIMYYRTDIKKFKISVSITEKTLMSSKHKTVENTTLEKKSRVKFQFVWELR